jgi:hypothetical protein
MICLVRFESFLLLVQCGQRRGAIFLAARGMRRDDFGALPA